jgi:hypothetical protein
MSTKTDAATNEVLYAKGLVAIGNFEMFPYFKLGAARLFVTMQDKVAFADIVSLELLASEANTPAVLVFLCQIEQNSI